MKEVKIQYDKYKGKTLMEALAAEGVETGGTCGGKGICGKCQVVADGRNVMACKTLVTGDMVVSLSEGGEDVNAKGAAVQLPAGFVWDSGEPGTYGVAVDLGTTTLVVMLWDLSTGTLVDLEAVSNPQRPYGADVMARMEFTLRTPWNGKRLQSSLINQINQTISALTMKHGITLPQIRRIAAVGNTTMSHFFLGEDVAGLAAYPFAPAFTGSVVTTARIVGLAAHEEAEVYVGPNIAGHVGSDITAGILAAGYGKAGEQANRLLLDIGTNGELFLTTRENAFCCSTAAGPAFEGSSLYQGMRAAEGAICSVALEDGYLMLETVKDGAPVGICGSGVIDAMAVMVENGIVDHFGRIDGPEEVNHFQLTEGDEKHPPVFVTQQDVREIQMAKAAIAAGASVLMDRAGITAEELEEVGIAGAFGSAIRIESAMRIGLLPKTALSKIVTLGNAAGIGASMLLLSAQAREEAEQIAAETMHVELAASTAFQTRYIEEMNF